MCAGLVAGKVVNALATLATYPVKNYRNSLVRTLSALLQLVIITAFPVLLTRLGHNRFVQDWQVSINGLLFISCFLSMQTSLINTVT